VKSFLFLFYTAKRIPIPPVENLLVVGVSVFEVVQFRFYYQEPILENIASGLWQ